MSNADGSPLSFTIEDNQNAETISRLRQKVSILTQALTEITLKMGCDCAYDTMPEDCPHDDIILNIAAEGIMNAEAIKC